MQHIKPNDWSSALVTHWYHSSELDCHFMNVIVNNTWLGTKQMQIVSVVLWVFHLVFRVPTLPCHDTSLIPHGHCTDREGVVIKTDLIRRYKSVVFTFPFCLKGQVSESYYSLATYDICTKINVAWDIKMNTIIYWFIFEIKVTWQGNTLPPSMFVKMHFHFKAIRKNNFI